MFNLGLSEILAIAVLTLLVVGPDDIPKMLRYVGRQYGKLTRYSDELRRAFMIEAEREESAARAAELKRKREEARRRADELRAAALAARPGEAEAPLPRPEPSSTPSPPPPPAPSPDAEPAPTTAGPALETRESS